MSADACLALLLDAPLQSWGHASRFERRTTALHPTRSAVLGLVAAALGIDKHADDEATRLARLAPLRLTTITLPRRDRRGAELPIRRLEDYHTVAFTREASATPSRIRQLLAKGNRPIGIEDRGSEIKQTYRHYLLDARFGALLEGPSDLLTEIATALANPRWGVWFGRKSCLPASPVLVSPPGPRDTVWPALLHRAGYAGDEPLTGFDHVLETTPNVPGADMIEDTPVGYGRPIGQRHQPRWILRQTRQRHADL